MRKVIAEGQPCRGNTGEWGRTVTYEVDTPLGATWVVDWERLPEPGQAYVPLPTEQYRDGPGGCLPLVVGLVLGPLVVLAIWWLV